MKIRALRFQEWGVDCYFHYAGICVRPVQYLNEFACENKGKWTEAFCTGSEYNEKVACETPGTWNEGMCSAPSSTTETGTTAANTFVTTSAYLTAPTSANDIGRIEITGATMDGAS